MNHPTSKWKRVVPLIEHQAKPATAIIGGIEGIRHRVVSPLSHDTSAYPATNPNNSIRHALSGSSLPSIFGFQSRTFRSFPFLNQAFLLKAIDHAPIKKNGSPKYTHGTIVTERISSALRLLHDCGLNAATSPTR